MKANSDRSFDSKKKISKGIIGKVLAIVIMIGIFTMYPLMMQEEKAIEIVWGAVVSQIKDIDLYAYDADHNFTYYVSRQIDENRPVTELLEGIGWQFQEEFGGEYIFVKADDPTQELIVKSKYFSDNHRLWVVPNNNLANWIRVVDHEFTNFDVWAGSGVYFYEKEDKYYCAVLIYGSGVRVMGHYKSEVAINEAGDFVVNIPKKYATGYLTEEIEVENVEVIMNLVDERLHFGDYIFDKSEYTDIYSYIDL